VTNSVSLPSFYCKQNVPFFLIYVIRNFSCDRSNLTRAESHFGLYRSNALYTSLDHGQNWWAFSKADHNTINAKYRLQILTEALMQPRRPGWRRVRQYWQQRFGQACCFHFQGILQTKKSSGITIKIETASSSETLVPTHQCAPPTSYPRRRGSSWKNRPQ
jgi:hypothetical protein